MQSQTRTFPAGGSLNSFAPGFPIRAVEVSNASASWLRVIDWYIPPFTFGWMHSFTPGMLRVTVQSVVGPDGQAIDPTGSPPIVIAYDETQRNSNGIHYLSNP